MSEIYSRMQDDANSPAKCRERRRHRIEMRRLAGKPSIKHLSSTSHHQKVNQTKSSSLEKKCSASSSSLKVNVKSKEDMKTSKEDAKTILSVPQPMYGITSVSGRLRDMEDAVCVSMCLLGPKSCQRPMYFFAVYDGHGGSRVSELCREKMHLIVQEELAFVLAKSGGGGTGAVEVEATWVTVMRRSFRRMDEVALTTCACGSVGGKCECHPMQLAFGGSTAVFAVLTPGHIVVANCGDSRAVLCRGGTAIPLSTDHKPDRIDELKRILAGGGRVMFNNGARVEGILAMSRAIGDKYLKSVVISEPEVTFLRRASDDEFIVLASDGLWDVVSSELSCSVARECLFERTTNAAATTATATIDLNDAPQIEEEPRPSYRSRSERASQLLTNLAMGRRSKDNISVIIVDLKTN